MELIKRVIGDQIVDSPDHIGLQGSTHYRVVLVGAVIGGKRICPAAFLVIPGKLLDLSGRKYPFLCPSNDGLGQVGGVNAGFFVEARFLQQNCQGIYLLARCAACKLDADKGELLELRYDLFPEGSIKSRVPEHGGDAHGNGSQKTLHAIGVVQDSVLKGRD